MSWGLTAEVVDLTEIDWATSRSSTTGGALLKARVDEAAETYYYKCPSYSPGLGFWGVESQNELVASRLLQCYGIAHTTYELVHAMVRHDGSEQMAWVAKSKSFLAPGEERTSLEATLDALGSANHENRVRACKDLGLWESLSQIMIADYLTVNRDRHGANIEVLTASDGSVRLAPAFDFGLSLTAPYARASRETIADIDPLDDVPVNNYLGSRSLEENLCLAQLDLVSATVSDSNVDYITEDLEEAYPSGHIEKIRDILKARCRRFENLRDLEERNR